MRLGEMGIFAHLPFCCDFTIDAKSIRFVWGHGVNTAHATRIFKTCETGVWTWCARMIRVFNGDSDAIERVDLEERTLSVRYNERRYAAKPGGILLLRRIDREAKGAEIPAGTTGKKAEKEARNLLIKIVRLFSIRA